MSEEPLPDGAEWTEDGWRLDLPGRIDPRPSIHWSTAMVLVAVLMIAVLTTPWMLLLFLPAVLVTLNPRGGTPIHGLELKWAMLEIYGLQAFALQQVTDPVATESGLDLTLEGVRRSLIFDAPPENHRQIVERIQRDLAAHGTTEDVPAQMHALREAET